MTTKTATFGDELRRWRTLRRMSQLDLAVGAEVSQRHLSFLETGRSKPSPEMVIHLGRALELTLRDQNVLLGAAGFAPAFTERDLDDPDFDQVRTVLDTIVKAHGHYPAYVVDRGWDLVLVNPIAGLLTTIVEHEPPPDVAVNAMRLVMHPLGLRSVIANWPQAAASLLHRLERELAHSPHDDRLRALLDEVVTYPGVAELPSRGTLPGGNDLVLRLDVDLGETQLRFFTTITTIGAPFDITLEELRLETLLPADRETDRFLRETAETLPIS